MPDAIYTRLSNGIYETELWSTSKKYAKGTTWPDARLAERAINLNKPVVINGIQVFLRREESLCSGRLGRVHTCYHMGRL
jgi:hypothetical protein